MSLFVKENEKIDIKYKLYFDKKLNLAWWGETEENIKTRITAFNEWLKADDDDEIKVGENESQDNSGDTINKEIAKPGSSEQVDYKPDCLYDIHLRVRNPNHDDVNRMLSESTRIEEGEMKVDINKYFDLRVRTLLLDWNFKNDEGNKMPVNDFSINQLNHRVFQSIVEAINKEVPLYLT